MSLWNLALPAGLTIRESPGHPGSVPVFAAGCPGAAIGRARILDVGSGVQAVIDDDQLRTDCRRGDQPRHDHRGDISHGYTPYAKPLITPTTPGRPGQPQAFALLGLELTGYEGENGNTIRLQAEPVSPLPPRPHVDLTPMGS